MPLLFKHGALTSNQQYSIKSMLDKYSFPVLLKNRIDHNWINANLIEHEYVGESGSSGLPYIKRSHLYGCVTTNYGILYFFEDRRDYDKVCELIDDVIDINPLTTIIM